MGIDQTTEFKVMMTNELSIKIFNFLAPRASASAWLYVILWKYNISWKKSSSLQLSIDKTNWAYICSNDDQAVVDEYCKFLSFPQGKSCFARVLLVI